MGKKLDLSGLPEPMQEAIWNVVHPKVKINRSDMADSISDIDDDKRHAIKKILFEDEINLVRRMLKQRKQGREKNE